MQDMMDKPIEKRSVLYRFRYYFIGGGLFMLLLVYIIIVASGGRRLKVNADNLIYATANMDKFLEYVETEGVIQPSLTLQVNTSEGGVVAGIIADNGTMLEKGDTILVLENTTLVNELNDEKNSYESKLLSFKEKELILEKSSLTLRESIMEAEYNLDNLETKFELEKEEYDMGVKSKAQLEAARKDYEHQKRKSRLQLEMLRNDSVTAILSREIFESDIDREKRNYLRSMERISALVVRAPIAGQLSSLQAALGQTIAPNNPVADIKVLDPFKLGASISEYYIDKIVPGLAAYVIDQGVRYPLEITKVIPEINERIFKIDLKFAGEQPDNVRIGKSYRIQVELDQPQDAIVIPRGDFFTVTGGHWVYKVNQSSNKAVKAYITIGRQNPHNYEVLSGLEPGDRVIVSGYSNFGDADELILK